MCCIIKVKIILIYTVLNCVTLAFSCVVKFTMHYVEINSHVFHFNSILKLLQLCFCSYFSEN